MLRRIEIPAADVNAARRHISSQRPEPLTPEAKIRRAELEARR